MTQIIDASRQALYIQARSRITALIAGETDEISALASVVCELHHGFAGFHWTGFYRVIEPKLLAVGPYQGGHGCLRIPFDRGVCGACARTGTTQLVSDVNTFTDHIACSTTTQSEIVVPVKNSSGEVVAVLDIDSDIPAYFNSIDQIELEAIVALLLPLYG